VRAAGFAVSVVVVAALSAIFGGVGSATGSVASTQRIESQPRYALHHPRFKWPGNPAVIKYHNQIDGLKTEVNAAARAWNRSGVDIKFREVPASNARVKIKRERHIQCGNGYTQSFWVNGRAKSAVVLIGTNTRGLGTQHQCTYVYRLVIAHELGHALGLDHEDGTCAVMNTTLTAHFFDGEHGEPFGVFPSECRDSGPDRWYCRILARDDLRGARKLYGGDVHVRNPAYCPV
jgi:hypothetical protein